MKSFREYLIEAANIIESSGSSKIYRDDRERAHLHSRWTYRLANTSHEDFSDEEMKILKRLHDNVTKKANARLA